jgi:hypothetical protein
VHQGVTLDLTALHFKALTLARLPRGRNPAVSECGHGHPCQLVSARQYMTLTGELVN